MTVLPISFFPATGFVSQLPSIDVSMLWHQRHEHAPAQTWLREAVTQAATETLATA